MATTQEQDQSRQGRHLAMIVESKHTKISDLRDELCSCSFMLDDNKIAEAKKVNQCVTLDWLWDPTMRLFRTHTIHTKQQVKAWSQKFEDAYPNVEFTILEVCGEAVSIGFNY